MPESQLEAIDHPVAEYHMPIDGHDWRVDLWEDMAAEFSGLKREELSDFHIFVQHSISQRSWIIIRRLFGIMPKDVPLAGDPDNYRAWNRKELSAKLGITEADLTAELEAVRLAWRRKTKADQDAIDAPKPIPPPDHGQPVAYTDEQNDALLVRFGFDPKIFDLPQRDKVQNTVERNWFCKRIREWESLLTKSTMTEQLALDTLSNELRLRREKQALWDIDREGPAGVTKNKTREARKNQIADRIKELQALHRQQLEAITEHAPWFNVSDAQISATGAIAQLIQGIQEWEADGNNKIIDGVFTSTELQVLLRTSKQIPEPRYRWGWVMYINESKKWLWDPRAKAWMRDRDLAKFDAGFKEGVKKFNDTSDAKVVDLEADGPEGQYEDLKQENAQ